MKHRIIFLCIIVLASGGLSFSIAFPSFNILFVHPSFQSIFAQSYGEPFILYGMLLACYPLGQLLGAPLLGDLSDRFGRRQILLMTILASFLGNALCTLSILIHQYPFLLLSRFITGFFCANTPICLSLIMEQFTEQQKRLKVMGNIAILNGMTWIGGVLIGAFISNSNITNYFHPAYTFALPALLFLLAYFYGLKAVQIQERIMKLTFSLRNLKESLWNIKGVFNIKELKLYYLIFLIWMIAWGIIFQWYNIYSSLYLHASPFMIAATQCLNGVSSIAGGLCLNKILSKYFSRSRLIIGSFALVLALTAGMIFNHGSFSHFASYFILGCFPAAIVWSSSLSRIGSAVQDNLRGKAMGVAQSCESLAYVGVTLLGGILEAKIPGNLLRVAAFFLIICIFLDYLTMKPEKTSFSIKN